MNIFTKYTLRNLKKNRTRTLITIIGITVAFIEDEAFFRLCETNGEKPEKYRNADTPLGLLHDNFSEVNTIDGKPTFFSFSALKKKLSL